MTDQPPADREASSRVPWPPIIYGAAFLVALALNWRAPFHFLPAAANLEIRFFGGLALLAALAIAIWAEREFLRAGTATLPTSPTKAIVSTGPFAFSRNPMYLGMTLALFGLAFLANSMWFLIAAPLAMALVIKLAIEPEEAYLTKKFGATYLEYKAAVRRWV